MPADPLTPRDWASQFDREFAENEPLGWSAEEEAGPSEREGVPAIVMPSLDEGDVTSTPGSTWSFTGEDDGEDLPPTTSPTFGEVEVMKRDEAGLEEAMASMDVQPELSSTPPTRSTAAPLASSPPGPIPIRSHTVQSFDIPGPSRVQVTPGETISPPDPSLIAAATEEEPLGPGVTRDTEVTPAGTLRKEVDGEVVEVPADEVALGVEEAVRERSSEG
jgi:SIT4-associating protein SAP185/190